MNLVKKNKIWLSIIFLLSFSSGVYSISQMTHRLVIADEGNGKVHYVNLNNPSEKWSATCSNRDLQLIGNDRLLVSDNGGSGYSEFNLTTGALLRHVALSGVANGINSAFCLSSKNVYCTRDGSPAKIIKTDSTGKILSSINIDATVRICRPTTNGTFIIGGKAAGMLTEFDSTGKKIWECNAGGDPYMALRLPNGTTLISTGYSGQMVLADKQGAVIKKFPQSSDKLKDSLFWKQANPNFFAGFQILSSGSIVVANWQGHGAGHGNSGYQLIEIDSALTMPVSYWKQDASMVSSIHGVLVLDNIDTKILHSDYNGKLQPIPDPVAISLTSEIKLEKAIISGAASVRVFDLHGRLMPLQGANCRFVETKGNIPLMRGLENKSY